MFYYPEGFSSDLYYYPVENVNLAPELVPQSKVTWLKDIRSGNVLVTTSV